MLYKSQWVYVPLGASGSSTINTSDRVPSGGLLHVSGGEMFSPSDVYLAGIAAPFSNAGLLNWNSIFPSLVHELQHPDDLQALESIDSRLLESTVAGVKKSQSNVQKSLNSVCFI